MTTLRHGIVLRGSRCTFVQHELTMTLKCVIWNVTSELNGVNKLNLQNFLKRSVKAVHRKIPVALHKMHPLNFRSQNRLRLNAIENEMSSHTYSLATLCDPFSKRTKVFLFTYSYASNVRTLLRRDDAF